MALGSHKDKAPTRQELMLKAQAIDDARQLQIANQVRIINRLTEINQTYEAVLEDVARNYYEAGVAHDMAAEALDKAAKINQKWREEQEQENKG